MSWNDFKVADEQTEYRQFPLKLKQFCGSCKKIVLTKRYIINRIMNRVCLIWKICHSGVWVIRKILFLWNSFLWNFHAPSWQIFHVNETLLIILSIQRYSSLPNIIQISHFFFFQTKFIDNFYFHENICCGYSLEMSWWGTSNEYHNIWFRGDIRKILSWFPII